MGTWKVIPIVLELHLTLTASAGSAAVVGHLSWPSQWQVFGPLARSDPVLPTDALRSVPEIIEVAGRELRARTVTPTDNRFDFARLFGGVKTGNTAYVFLPLVATEDGEATLGMGADWWMQVWVDGQLILDTTTSRHGNVAWPPDISDFMVNVRLTKGEHVLAVRFISGKASSRLALGGPDQLREVPVERYFEKAKRSLRKGEFDSAIAQLTHVIGTKPDLAKAHFWRGVACCQVGAPSLGLNDIRRANALGYTEVNPALLDIEKAPLFERTPRPTQQRAPHEPRPDPAPMPPPRQRADVINKAALVYVVPAIANTEIRPDDEHIVGTLGGELSVVAAPGEYEPASFVVSALTDVADMRIEVSDLEGSATELPSSSVDIKAVKCWYHEGLHWRQDRPRRVLAPQLLLNDDALITVDREKQKNYLKLSLAEGTEHVDLSDPRLRTLPIDEFPIKDSPTLLPVSISAQTNKQFWVTIRVPDKAKAGMYVGKIRFSSAAREPIDALTIKLRSCHME